MDFKLAIKICDAFESLDERAQDSPRPPTGMIQAGSFQGITMSVFRCSAAAVATVFAIGLSSGAYAAVPTVTYATHQDESRPMRDVIAEQANTPYQGSSEEPYVVPNIFPKQS